MGNRYGTSIFAYFYLFFSLSLSLSLFSLFLFDFSYTLRDDRSVLQTIDSRPSTTRPPSCSYKLSDVPTSLIAREEPLLADVCCDEPLLALASLAPDYLAPPLFLSLFDFFLLTYLLLSSSSSSSSRDLSRKVLSADVLSRSLRLCRCPSAKLNDRVFRAPAQLRYPSTIDITMLRYRDAILRHLRLGEELLRDLWTMRRYFDIFISLRNILSYQNTSRSVRKKRDNVHFYLKKFIGICKNIFIHTILYCKFIFFTKK